MVLAERNSKPRAGDVEPVVVAVIAKFRAEPNTSREPVGDSCSIVAEAGCAATKRQRIAAGNKWHEPG